MAKDISLPNSNLYLKGFGFDTNGFSVVKLTYPNARSFSIRMNKVLIKTHDISKRLPKKGIEGLTDTQLKDIRRECISYIRSYGTDLQIHNLRISGSIPRPMK